MRKKCDNIHFDVSLTLSQSFFQNEFKLQVLFYHFHQFICLNWTNDANSFCLSYLFHLSYSFNFINWWPYRQKRWHSTENCATFWLFSTNFNNEIWFYFFLPSKIVYRFISLRWNLHNFPCHRQWMKNRNCLTDNGKAHVHK